MNTLEVIKEAAENKTATPMPMYQSFKQVAALKIKKVHRDEWGIVLVFEGSLFAPHALTNDQLKHKPDPQDGWYYVVYSGGYESFSPADEFEKWYSRI